LFQFMQTSTDTTEFSTLSLHDALPICRPRVETRLPFIVRTHRWRADVALQRAITWWLRVEGDANHAMLSLGDARLSMIEIVGAADRKSTRLNSSHVSISYAVFCLKKII